MRIKPDPAASSGRRTHLQVSTPALVLSSGTIIDVDNDDLGFVSREFVRFDIDERGDDDQISDLCQPGRSPVEANLSSRTFNGVGLESFAIHQVVYSDLLVDQDVCRLEEQRID